MDFARELKRLYDEGWDFKKIARIACKSEHYIRDYIRLVEQGEERLIHGVEQGIFPIKFAILVASTDDGQLQNVLMDAFDENLVTTNNFAQARQIITARARSTKTKKVPQQFPPHACARSERVPSEGATTLAFAICSRSI